MWVVGTIAYALIVALLGLVLLDSLEPEYTVFPPLLTALAGLFVATAINVRPGLLGDDGADWNRFQTHVIVVAVTSMVLSMGLVMSAIAFPGEQVARTAFWGSAIAILIGASFLLATVWNRLSGEDAASEETTPKAAREPSSGEETTPKKVKRRKKSGKKKPKKQPKKKDTKKKN